MQENKPLFKVRCSSIEAIMTNPRTKSDILSATCIGVAEEWMKEQLYGTKRVIVSKYLEKGLKCEDAGIKLANEINGTDYIKNTERLTDEFFTGECDVNAFNENEIWDIKNSFSASTFPIFKESNKDYYGQLQGYMYLYQRSKAKLIYTLCDAPEEMIERECWNRLRMKGETELEEEFYNEVKDELTYSYLPKELRYKEFNYTFDNDYINSVIERVKLIREYIEKNTNFYQFLNKK